jgi:Na+/H+ antiporter NhaD/arsenite permease-like protein
MLQKLYVFFRKETVLSIAVILAILSMFWVRPDKAYFTYIDFRTLGLLFCLMAIVAGLKAVGVFDILAQKLLMGTSGTVGVIRLLVLLCFFLSMVITNDVALITFVPLALIIVHKLPKELGNYWLLKIVAMQTIAANLGSMLTPIGNPQNLYLYARAGMSAAELITLMLPYSATALILLLIWIQVAAAKAPHVCGSEKDKTLLGFSDRKELNMEYLAAYLILFTICLLTVARIIPYQIPLVLVLIYMLLRNRENISRVDYSLLATFIALFIFIGNLGRIPQFSSFLERIMAGRETLTAVLASQIMSNVPAALLLSGFTDNYRALIVGSQDQAKAVSESLEKKGFKDSDYIVYINQSKPVEKSFWSKLFTDDIDQEATAVDSLITSVAINNDTELQLAKDAFRENKVVNTYELPEVDFANCNSV